jgi:hypothetical protein
VFFIFSPNGAGDFSFPLLKYTHRSVVQPRCNSLQNFAICEIADRLQSPTVRLGCSFVCTTSDFAQKKNTNPVGGRGISAFFRTFFLHILLPGKRLSQTAFEHWALHLKNSRFTAHRDNKCYMG